MSMQDQTLPPKTRRRKEAEPWVEPAEVKVAFDDNRLASLVLGQFDEHLAHIERKLGVRATANGNQVQIKGTPDAAEQARRVLSMLDRRVKEGRGLSLGDVDGAIAEAVAQGSLFPAVSDTAKGRRINWERSASW